jgi:IS605 OrfB family transposase
VKFNRSSVCHTYHLTSLKKEKIKSILSEYSKVCNYFIETYENQILKSTTTKLQFLYAEYIQKCIKDLNTDFSARMIKNAFAEAYGMLQSAKSLSKSKKYVRPVHYGKKACLSQTIVTLDFDTKILYDMVLHLKCIGNRQHIQIPLKRHQQFNKWLKEGVISKNIILFQNKIQFSFEVEKEKKKTSGITIGIDLGINKFIATSNRNTYGEKYKNLLQKLDRKKFHSNAYSKCKHEIESYVNLSCKSLPWNELQTIVVEKLKNVKFKMRSRSLGRKTRRFISNWNYRQVLKRLQALSEENRVSFRSVPSYYTSQTCPICSHRDKGNRLDQEHFVCQSCGFADNADFVGAQNVLNLFLTGPYCAS